MMHVFVTIAVPWIRQKGDRVDEFAGQKRWMIKKTQNQTRREGGREGERKGGKGEDRVYGSHMTAAAAGGKGAAAEVGRLDARPHAPSSLLVLREKKNRGNQEGNNTKRSSHNNSSPDERTLVLPFVTHRDSSPLPFLLNRGLSLWLGPLLCGGRWFWLVGWC